MIFDGLPYVGCLAHLGRPTRVPSLPFAVLLRPIPGTSHHDALSTWPYGSPPEAAKLASALEELRALGAVSFTGMLTPAATRAADLASGAIAVAPLKPHYLIDARRALPAHSAKTRRNLKLAARHWTIDAAPARAEIAQATVELYAALRRRRRMSSEITDMPPGHFAALLDVPGIVALAARDRDRIGAVLIAARDAEETHLLHLLADEQALATVPNYLLMAHISEAWSQRGPIYLGGAPGGPDGPGVAKFKARWANHTAPSWLVTAVLREDVYKELSPAGATAGGFFPAYRA
jgi:hypothetical protein